MVTELAEVVVNIPRLELVAMSVFRGASKL